MNPKKTKSGKYHVTAYIGKVNGKPYYKSFTAPTKRECVLKATEYINHHKEMTTDPTVKSMVQEYISSKEGVLSPSTIREYYRIYQHDLVPLYGVKLSELNNITLQNFVSGMNLAPKTIANRYRFLMSAVGMFSDKRYKVTLPQPKAADVTVASEEDIQLLLDKASDNLRKAILLGSCSMRRGEICALKYEDIEGNTIHVHADMVNDKNDIWVYKDHAKTPNSTRTIVVPEYIIKALGSGKGYVVNYNPNALTQAFCRLRDRLGINVSLHSLRRFYASVSHALGIPDKYIMKQGGWKSPDVMRRSYQRTLDKQEQEFQNKFDSYLSDTIKIQ